MKQKHRNTPLRWFTKERHSVYYCYFSKTDLTYSLQRKSQINSKFPCCRRVLSSRYRNKRKRYYNSYLQYKKWKATFFVLHLLSWKVTLSIWFCFLVLFLTLSYFFSSLNKLRIEHNLISLIFPYIFVSFLYVDLAF